MKQKIILISGLAGSGKTTTGEILQEKLESCARIESDFLILVKPFVRGENLSKLKIKNTCDVVRNFVQEGFENLLVVGAVWNKNELEHFLSVFSDVEYDVYLFWLEVSQETRFARAQKRQDPGDDSESLMKTEEIHQTVGIPESLPNGKFYRINITDITTSGNVAEEILDYLQ